MITSPLSLVVNRRFPLQTFLVYWTLSLSLSSLSLINHTIYSSKYRLLPLSYSPSSSPSSRIQFDVSDLGVKCELGFDLSTNRLRVRFEITVRVDSSVLFVVRLQWLLEGAGLYREWISISVSNFGNCECEVGLIRFGKPYCFGFCLCRWERMKRLCFDFVGSLLCNRDCQHIVQFRFLLLEIVRWVWSVLGNITVLGCVNVDEHAKFVFLMLREACCVIEHFRNIVQCGLTWLSFTEEEGLLFLLYKI